MTARLGYSPAERHPSFDLLAKNVDEGPKTQGFSSTALSGLGYLGHGAAREIVLRNTAAGRHRSSDSADRMLVANVPPLSAEEIEAFDYAELDAEEAGARHRQSVRNKYGDPAHEERKREREERFAATDAIRSFELPNVAECDREASDVADFLPPELRRFLQKMPIARRREREAAILAYVGWTDLERMSLWPRGINQAAAVEAAEYASRWPSKDKDGNPANLEPEHRKNRDEKTWRRRLRKAQNRAILYVEAAVGAVGGRNVPGRPLYVSDYALGLHRQHVEHTEEALRDLFLVRKDDPTVRVPMSIIHESAMERAAAKRRLLIDMNLIRWEMLGWYVCWITITLPGAFVPNSTNEGFRASEWNPAFGPMEAMDAIQDDHHRVLAAAREAGVRPCGWWNAQPQQSGAPHRHYILACRTLEEARLLCDHFRAKFSSRKDGDDVQDRGCRAYVLGDEHPEYHAPNGRNGAEETAASVARYSARYATRHERKSGSRESVEGSEGSADGESSNAEKKQGDGERFAAWKRPRRARTHTWLGLDSRRAPNEIWDTIHANATRMDFEEIEKISDLRMRLAVRHMKLAQRHGKAAHGAREEVEMLALECKVDPNHAGLRESYDKALAQARAKSEQASVDAWHAAIALGMWPDSDLDPAERIWLADAVKSINRCERDALQDPLPPEPLRVQMETKFGETRSAIKGAIGLTELCRVDGEACYSELLLAAELWGVDLAGIRLKPKRVTKAIKDAGIRVAKRPCGTTVYYKLGDEALLTSEHDWEILDYETSLERIVEAKEKLRETAIPTVGLSDSPTDPRERASPHPVRDWDEILHILIHGLEDEQSLLGTRNEKTMAQTT